MNVLKEYIKIKRYCQGMKQLHTIIKGQFILEKSESWGDEGEFVVVV